MSIHHELAVLDVVLRRLMFGVLGASLTLGGWWLYTTYQDALVFSVSWVGASVVLNPVWTLLMGNRDGFTVFPYPRIAHQRIGYLIDNDLQWVVTVVLPRLLWEVAAIGLGVTVVWMMHRYRWRWLPRGCLPVLGLGFGFVVSWLIVVGVFYALKFMRGGDLWPWANPVAVTLIGLGTLIVCGVTWRWHTIPFLQMCVTAIAGAVYLRLMILHIMVQGADIIGPWLLIGGSVGGALFQATWYYVTYQQLPIRQVQNHSQPDVIRD